MSPLPPVHTVKHRGRVVVRRARPVAVRLTEAIDGLGDGPRNFVAAVFGLWPVTVTLLAGVVMTWAAVVGNGP
jgi:hypothetical protein